MNKELLDIISYEAILKRTEDDWDCKTFKEKKRKGKKFTYVCKLYNVKDNNWILPFNSLSSFQKSLLIKGEVIRTYNALPNKDKTILKNYWNLHKFATKWYNLLSVDKITILKFYKIYISIN